MAVISLLRQTGYFSTDSCTFYICILVILHTSLTQRCLFKPGSRSIGPEMFEGEALGLSAMYETKSIRVPQPFKVRFISGSF